MMNVLSQITDSVKRYSFLLGQTELFKHFVDIKVCFRSSIYPLVLLISFVLQRARDPEYAALMDAQPQPKKRGRKKAAYVSRP